jgi:hypothetical protein
MAAGSTYTPIATTTLGSAANSYTFSSIPSSYTDLVIVMNGTAATADVLVIQFNGDTANNYSTTSLQGTSGNTAVSQRQTTQARIVVGGFQDNMGTTVPSMVTINVFNYANTTTNKTAISRMNNFTDSTTASTGATVGLYRSTSAITSIKLALATGANNLAIGTTFTLYGIAAA